jgi:RecA/RadA recombinase
VEKPLTSYETIVKIMGNHALMIYGDAGTGKSRLLHAICVEAQTMLGKKCLYIDTEGSLPESLVGDLDNYEYIGPDLKALIDRVSLAKRQRDQFDLLAVDSIGFPVLTSYASMPLNERLSAILSLTNVLADAVRFARASKHESLPAPDKMNLSILTNQPKSEFTRVTEGLGPEDPLDPFGGKLSFIAKLILRTEVAERGENQSRFRLLVHKARDLPRGRCVAEYMINQEGVAISWLV